jgi:hypothetical protein
MQRLSNVSNVSNDALLQSLHRLVDLQRCATADIVLHLAEMDARRLHAKKGFPSLFSYCVEELRFSEDEACRRIEAARLGRRFPQILELLKTGTVTLTVLGLLKPHLTYDNHRELLAGVSRSSVRQAKEWLAAQFPKPDVPCSIRRLPERAHVAPEPAPPQVPHSDVATPHHAAIPPAPPQVPHSDVATPERAGSSPARSRRARIEPLSRDSFLVKLTAHRTLRDKLELARDLMSHANPSGDLAVVIERALDVLLRELEKAKLGRATRSDRKSRPAKWTHVTNATRREVVARDGLRCSFVAGNGRSCRARAFLEFDHAAPRGRGGDSGPNNVRLLCRAHNLLAAERVYGAAHMQRAVSKARGDGMSGKGPAAPEHIEGRAGPRAARPSADAWAAARLSGRRVCAGMKGPTGPSG